MHGKYNEILVLEMDPVSEPVNCRPEGALRVDGERNMFHSSDDGHVRGDDLELWIGRLLQQGKNNLKQAHWTSDVGVEVPQSDRTPSSQRPFC